MDEMQKDWPQFMPLFEAQCVTSAVDLWTVYHANPQRKRDQYRETMKSIADFARLHRKEAIKHMHLGLAGRLVLPLVAYDTWWSFTLAGVIGRLSRIVRERIL